MTLKEQAQRLLDAKQTWRYPRITSFSADHVKIECEDQGGWPFTAFEYSGSNADRRAVDFLLVLSGELDVAALLAELDRLRVGIAETIEAMDAAKAAKSAPGNEAYDEGFNMACGFSKQLQIVLDDPKEDP